MDCICKGHCAYTYTIAFFGCHTNNKWENVGVVSVWTITGMGGWSRMSIGTCDMPSSLISGWRKVPAQLEAAFDIIVERASRGEIGDKTKKRNTFWRRKMYTHTYITHCTYTHSNCRSERGRWSTSVCITEWTVNIGLVSNIDAVRSCRINGWL